MSRFCSVLGYLGVTIFGIVSLVNFGMSMTGPPPPGVNADGLGYMFMGSLVIGFIAMIFALAGFGSNSALLAVVLVAAGSIYDLSFVWWILKNEMISSSPFTSMDLVVDLVMTAIATIPGTISIIEGIVLHRRKVQIK